MSMKELLDKLDKAFENRARLGIMSLLLVEPWVEFSTMKESLDLTDGNLAGHLKMLEEKGYVTFEKRFVGRKPQTSYSVTEQGRKAFSEHLDALEKLLFDR